MTIKTNRTNRRTQTIQLSHSNARYYDPATGRFLSEDPARDGVSWYGYCGGNPIGYIDPFGLYPKDGDSFQREKPKSTSSGYTGSMAALEKTGRQPGSKKIPPEDMERSGSAAARELTGEILVAESIPAFIWPLAENYITSPYGPRTDANPPMHGGIDLRAFKGTPVFASASGTVEVADLEYHKSDDRNSYLIINSKGSYQQRYVHMDFFLVQKDDTVVVGQLLGYTGTRRKTDPHLHFEILLNGKRIDPTTVLPINEK